MERRGTAPGTDPTPPAGLTPAGNQLGQRKRIVVNARRAQPLTSLGLPHDHAAPPVQIDIDDLPAVYPTFTEASYVVVDVNTSE
jgi:hypothetical protein